MNMITQSDASFILCICTFFWAYEKILKLLEHVIEWGVNFLRSLPDKKRSSRSSSEERDDSSELPEDINSIGQVSPSKSHHLQSDVKPGRDAYPGGLVTGNE